MLGSMGYTDDRTKVMLLTDPIYYFGTFLLQKKETSYSTFADISGHKIGTVTGFTLVPELKSIPNVGEVKLYDTSDGVIRDLVAGRLDMAVLDPGLVQYALLQHPEWNLHQVALTPEPDKYPIMSTKYYSIMAIYPEEKELYEAINAEIAKSWASCDNVKSMAEYGLGNKAWFDPPNPGLPDRSPEGLEGAEIAGQLLPVSDRDYARGRAAPGPLFPGSRYESSRPHHRLAQELRRHRSAERRRSRSRARRMRLHRRPQRLGQDHPAPLRQLPGAADRRRGLGRWQAHRPEGSRRPGCAISATARWRPSAPRSASSSSASTCSRI